MRSPLLLALLLALLATPARARAAEVVPTSDPGTLERHAIATPEGEADFLVYTPSTVDGSAAVPLYVMTHGCNTTALEQAQANLHHPVAERERFVVLYPDFAAATHPGRCWRWTDPASQVRDSGDPAVIAAQTRAVMAMRNIDPQRVYAMGMSSGAFMTSILGATYPDLYAAIGIMAGGPYRTYACLAADRVPRPQAETPVLARMARDAMGERARVLPFIELHGDADGTVPPGCGDQAVEQWLRTAGLVAGTDIALTPAATRRVGEAGRRDATVSEFADPDGCLLVEHWDIEGMDHFWSGGTSDPALAAFTDPAGPNAAEISWRFFSRFRRDETALPCAEARATGGAVTPAGPGGSCRSRRNFEIRLRRGLRAPRVTVGGRRVPVRRRGGRHVARVDLRGRPAGRVVVLVTARSASGGRWVVQRRVFRTCVPRRPAGRAGRAS